MLRACARVFFKSPEEGCQTVVFCAVADKLRDHSGKVIENCTSCKIKSSARDKELGQKLWNVSLQLCGLAEPTPETEENNDVDVGENARKKPGVEQIGPISDEPKKEK